MLYLYMIFSFLFEPNFEQTYFEMNSFSSQEIITYTNDYSILNAIHPSNFQIFKNFNSSIY
jgi:hypothetical protein